MPAHFDTIGLIGKHAEATVASTLRQLSDYLRDRGVSVLVDQTSAEMIAGQGVETVQREAMGERCDLAIVVGGDGTLLNAARALVSYDVPVLGVNVGRLGFLTDISPGEMLHTLGEILAGRYREEARWMLHATVSRGEETVSRCDALNDVVIHKWSVARMIEFETYIDGQFVNTQRSDGLIVSTPTGSTAYALSAGGPILHPTLNALVLAPICPHTLSNRPVVVDGDCRVDLVVGQNTQDAQVTCDGQISLGLLGGDRIGIGKKDRAIRLIHPADHDYFSLLRAKLSWGKHP
jgi:NAD+ kinase